MQIPVGMGMAIYRDIGYVFGITIPTILHPSTITDKYRRLNERMNEQVNDRTNERTNERSSYVHVRLTIVSDDQTSFGCSCSSVETKGYEQRLDGSSQYASGHSASLSSTPITAQITTRRPSTVYQGVHNLFRS